jgi:hypothetical protein
VSNTSAVPEPYFSAFCMKSCGDREVEAVIFAGVQSPQELQALLQPPILRPDGVCAAQRQVVHRTRPGLSPSELRDSGGEILVDGDLDAGLGRRHDPSVPPWWATPAIARADVCG